jgi:hypothetical protein
VGLLAGCGQTGPGASPSPSPLGPSRPAPGLPPSTSISSSSAGGPGTAATSPSGSDPDLSGASFGVDRLRWPGTIDGAKRVLNAMPKSLGDTKRELYDNSGAGEDPPSRDAGVVYGRVGSAAVYEEYRTNDTADGKPQLESANNRLSAAFGLVYACAKGSYEGTAPRPSYPGGGPGVTKKPITTPIWFSCTVHGAEGDDNFTGQAVGWTSKKTAWLVVADSETSARHLVHALALAGP